MKRVEFNDGMAALLSAFPYIGPKVKPETEEIYWNMLQKIPSPAWTKGIQQCLATNEFFPTIAHLGEASMPTKVRLGRYNPHVSTEPRKIPWYEQIEEIEHQEERKRGKIPKNVKGLISGIGQRIEKK